MSDEAADEGIEIGRLTITRTVNDDPDREQGDRVWIEMSDDLTVIEALGMIEIARHDILHPHEDDD